MIEELAFPQNELSQYDGSVCMQHFGLRMRDYFAAAALPALLAELPEEQAVPLAYKTANLMMKERLIEPT